MIVIPMTDMLDYHNHAEQTVCKARFPPSRMDSISAVPVRARTRRTFKVPLAAAASFTSFQDSVFFFPPLFSPQNCFFKVPGSTGPFGNSSLIEARQRRGASYKTEWEKFPLLDYGRARVRLRMICSINLASEAHGWWLRTCLDSNYLH